MTTAQPIRQQQAPAGHFDLCSYLFFPALLVNVLIHLGTGLQNTSAILPEEFDALAMLLRWQPFLQGLQWLTTGLLVLALGVLAGNKCFSPARKMALFLSLPCLFLFHVSTFVFLVPLAMFAFLYLDYFLRHGSWQQEPEQVQAIARCVRESRARHFPQNLLDVLLLCATAAIVFGLLEAWIYTRPFSGWLFSMEDYQHFVLFAIGNAVHYAAQLAGLILCLLVGLLALSKLALACRLIRASSLPVFLALMLAIWGGMLGIQLMMSVLYDEITAVGFLPVLITTVCSLTTLLTLSTYRNLQMLLHGEERVQNFRDLAYFLLLAACAPGLRSVWSAVRRLGWFKENSLRQFTFVWGMGLLVLLCALMVWLNYPTLHDYSTIALRVYSTLIIFIGLTFLFVSSNHFGLRGKTFPWKVSLPGLLLLSIASMAAMWLQSERPNVKVIANEYAVINKVFLQQKNWNRIFFWHEPRAFPAESEDFVLHPPGFDRYADLPAQLHWGEKRPPIIIILVDALRGDHMGCYGYARDTSPHMDAFANDAVVFERGYSPATATTAATRSLLTGKYSSRFMLEDNLPPYFTQDLVEQGYRHFLITAWDSNYNGVSMPNFMDSLRAEDGEIEFQRFYPDDALAQVTKAEEVLPAMIQRAQQEKEGEQGWMMYWHMTHTHFPWKRRDGAKDFGDSPIDLYDHNIHYCDIAFGRFMDLLKEQGVYEEAIIILCADHGTGLRDHGRYGGFLNYEEQIKIPFIIKYPGIRPKRIAEPVSLLDIAPTLVHNQAIGEANRFDGISLLPGMVNSQSSGRLALFSLCAFEDAYSVMLQGRWKYIWHRWEAYEQLFDLEQDPLERTNLLHTQKDMRKRLSQLMDAFLWAGRDNYDNPWHFKRPRHAQNKEDSE